MVKNEFSEQEVIEFITKLKRGQINISIMAEGKQCDEGYIIYKNSAVKIKSINRKVALYKFKEFFSKKLLNLSERYPRYSIKIEQILDDNKKIYQFICVDGKFYDKKHEPKQIMSNHKEKTSSSKLLNFLGRYIEITEDEYDIYQESLGKTHIIYTIEAKTVVTCMLLNELFIFLLLGYIPSMFLMWLATLSSMVALFAFGSIFYKMYKQEYYL